MFDLCRHTRLLKLLFVGYRLRSAWSRHTSKARRALRIRSDFYTEIWQDAVRRHGGTAKFLGEDFIELCVGDFRTRVLQNDTSMDDYVTVRLAGSKPISFRLFAELGLPIAKYAEFSLNDMGSATRFLRELGKECVVKPARGWGGVGVTTGIRTTRRLATAAAAATVYDHNLLIQEQIPGDFYRLVYLDGRLIDAVVRYSPTVRGDGKSTVGELVKRLNETRLQRGSELCQALLGVDLDMKSTLARQGFTLSSVPAQGAHVQLKTVINDNCADENAAAGDLLCESIIRDGAAATAAIGARLSGVDVIATDPQAPLTESGGVIMEVNTAPGQYWHYHRSGGAFPLAEHILAALLAEHDAARHGGSESMTGDQPASSLGTSTNAV